MTMVIDESRARWVRDTRKALGFTKHKLAAALRMGRNGHASIREWESAEKPIPGPVIVAMELMGTIKRIAGEDFRGPIPMGVLRARDVWADLDAPGRNAAPIQPHEMPADVWKGTI